MTIPCTRCGKCCEEAHACDIRGWLAKDRKSHFEGRCEFLIYNKDGTTTCRGIEMAFDPPEDVEWHEPTRKWIVEEFVGKGCELYDDLGNAVKNKEG